MMFNTNVGLLNSVQKKNRFIPASLNYTGLSGTPTDYNNLGRVKVFQNIYGPYINPEDPDLGFQWAEVVWKRCDSTSTYNDENYTDVRHNYSVGDLISFTSYSVLNGLGSIIKPITEVTDTTFKIRGVPADSVFASRPSVYTCTTLTRVPIVPTPTPNYFSNPYNIDTLLYPGSDLSGPGWYRGPSATRIGTTTAPDGSQNAVIYRSSMVPDCFVSQGYGAYWLPNTTYTFTVWAKLINDGGQPNNLGNFLSITKDAFDDRVNLSANGLIDNTWKKFSISFTTGSVNSGSYTTCFLFEGWQANQEVALWGAGLSIG